MGGKAVPSLFIASLQILIIKSFSEGVFGKAKNQSVFCPTTIQMAFELLKFVMGAHPDTLY